MFYQGSAATIRSPASTSRDATHQMQTPSPRLPAFCGGGAPSTLFAAPAGPARARERTLAAALAEACLGQAVAAVVVIIDMVVWA